MKVKFLRPAPYNYILPQKGLYDSYNAVAKGQADTMVNIADIPLAIRVFAKDALVIASPASRTKLTAEALSSDFVVHDDAAEIGYTMEQLMPSGEFAKFSESVATTMARKRYFPALFADKLVESHESALARVVALLKFATAQDKNVVVISHGFFMKLVEVAVLDPNAVADIKLFQKHYDGAKPAYDFLNGPTFTKAQVLRALRLLG